MSEQHPMMVGAATVFVVSDVARSMAHYRDALGFTVTFQYGNPTFYVCLCRDEVALHLLAAGETMLAARPWRDLRFREGC
jgi:catechol 2,3-dioxygenase-like lactoylglutathione lyase family enzyme